MRQLGEKSLADLPESALSAPAKGRYAASRRSGGEQASAPALNPRRRRRGAGNGTGAEEEPAWHEV
jgi:hypothetical protein